MYPELYQYLLYYKQLPVPGIGTFSLERTPAVVDFPNKMVYAPKYSFALKEQESAPSKKLYCWLGSLLNIPERDAVIRFNEFAYEMEQSGWQVTALEPDPGAREKAKELYGIHTADGNLLYELLPGSFDAVTLWHVLEHVHDLHKYLSQLSSVLNDHGKLFVAVPNYTSKDAAVYGEHWAAYDVPRHLYHFSPASMKLLMESHGFKIFRKQPMWYDSFYISMLSSRYKHGSTQLFSSFWNGLRSNLKALNNRERCSSVIYIMEKMK